MKKAISILLVLVMALSLCACGGNSSNNAETDGTSKYVGTYEGTTEIYFQSGATFDTSYKIVLNKGGTGTYTREFLEDYENAFYGEHPIKTGDLIFSYDLTWEIVDNYIVLTGNGKEYIEFTVSRTAIKWISGGKNSTISISYELKGNQLCTVDGDTTIFKKTK